MSNIYYTLSKIPLIKNNYSLKFLFVAFIGIHIPLISVIILLLSSPTVVVSKNLIFTIALIFTLIATALTLYILNGLLKPLIISKNALNNYLNNNQLPQLPTNYNDEVGILMHSVQKTLTSLDAHIKEKQEFTTLVSHNLRTPLNQIMGLCELVSIDSENTLSYVDKIESITDLQLQNLSELLVQLMGNEVKESSVTSNFDINELIKKEVEIIDLAIAKKNLTVNLNFKTKELISTTNKNKVALVVQNLISNAIKFSYEGQEINISTLKKDNNIEIIVKDEGIGFNDEYKKNLFMDARHTGRKGTKDEPSVGLGLHLCKRTINQLGGQLLAFSEGENKGSTFKIVL